MATYYIFIEDDGERQQSIGQNACYVYKNETLEVYNKGRVIYSWEAHKGDAFAVMCEKGKVILKKMVPPQRKGALVAWLMNFQKHNRADSLGEYEIKLRKYRQRYEWYGYKEWQYRSRGYVFTLCNSPYSYEPRNVAAFVSDAITKAEVLELIPLMKYHPYWYIQKLLQERFRIAKEEFEIARCAK